MAYEANKLHSTGGDWWRHAFVPNRSSFYPCMTHFDVVLAIPKRQFTEKIYHCISLAWKGQNVEGPGHLLEGPIWRHCVFVEYGSSKIKVLRLSLFWIYSNLIAFSRMRSEGFPFIVGVWGWTCVRFVLLPRRRLVVVSSSPRRRQLVNFSLLGGTHALRHQPVFQSMKSGGSLARNARFGGPKSQNVR